MYKKSNNIQESKTEKVFKEATEKLQQIVDSGEYKKFLKFQKYFTRYSFMNRILIYSQCPEATKVAGKKAWLKLGREVINQAKRIYILAPIPRTFEKKTTKIVDGEEKEVTETIKYNYYRYVFVYDISNTKGEQIPLERNNLNSNDKAELYEKLKAFSSVPVTEKELFGSMYGYYSEKANEIAIKKNLSPDDKVATLLHEITHSLYDDFDYAKDRDLSEVFVESVAYIVADHFGLDTSNCSFNYIIKWAKGEPKKVIKLGDKIIKSANQFIERIEKFEMEESRVAA